MINTFQTKQYGDWAMSHTNINYQSLSNLPSFQRAGILLCLVLETIFQTLHLPRLQLLQILLRNMQPASQISHFVYLHIFYLLS